MSPRPSSLGVPCTLRFAVSKSSPSGNHPARLRGVPRGSGESKVTTASARGPLLARGTGGWDGEERGGGNDTLCTAQLPTSGPRVRAPAHGAAVLAPASGRA